MHVTFRRVVATVYLRHATQATSFQLRLHRTVSILRALPEDNFCSWIGILSLRAIEKKSPLSEVSGSTGDGLSGLSRRRQRCGGG